MKVRIAPSLGGGFSGTPQEVWGVEEYIGEYGHKDYPTVFFGLYGLPDFFSLWRHKGKKYILWAGSDIQHFLNGYWLDTEGKMRIHPIQLSSWIDTYCESYVENEVEQQALRSVGIRSKVVPSFLGNVDDYDVEYCYDEKPKVYTSVSGDDFKLYGWDKIDALAEANPDIEFHLYGNVKTWLTNQKNVIIHGRVPQEQMNEEIKKMQGSLRLTEFDGCSELVVKALLWGQYCFSLIDYPGTLKPNTISTLHHAKAPNHTGRDWLLSVVNKYPWNVKNN